MITIDTTRERLATIMKAAQDKDNERAHALEDRLHIDVLKHIAIGQITLSEAKLLASMALTTKGLEFKRWCA